MKPLLRSARGVLAASFFVVTSAAHAAYPEKPITLIVPFAPAGIADIVARTVAQAMQASLGQTIVIDNRPSAGSIVGSQAVANAAPDGYTLLLMSNGNAVSVSMFKKLPFDVTKDFAPVSTLGYFDLALLVDKNARFKTVQELIAHGKASPGKLTVGTIAVGSTQHLSAELFKIRTGLDAVVVPYKGSPAVLNALRAGEVDVGFEIVGPALGQLSAGTVRALAVTSGRRNPALPQIPTLAESGISNYDVASWNAIAAPKGTPAAVVERLNRAAMEAVSSEPVQKRLKELGVRAQGSSPAELATLLATEINRWREVMKAAKIQPE